MSPLWLLLYHMNSNLGSIGRGNCNSGPESQATALKVANSIAPIPAKLVKKIQALEFVDMRELLPDNIALTERLEALPSGLALVTWVSSFATYIAIIAEAHPSGGCSPRRVAVLTPVLMNMGGPLRVTSHIAQDRYAKLHWVTM